jgi:plastocyanin
MLVAFLLGFLMGGPLMKTFGAGVLPFVKMYVGGSKGGTWSPPGGGSKMMGVVAIIPGKGGAEFNPPAIKLPAGNTLTWINKTGQAQTLVTDSNSKNITLAPGQPADMLFTQAGRSYTWHLASNPQVSVTVYIGGR